MTAILLITIASFIFISFYLPWLIAGNKNVMGKLFFTIAIVSILIAIHMGEVEKRQEKGFAALPEQNERNEKKKRKEYLKNKQLRERWTREVVEFLRKKENREIEYFSEDELVKAFGATGEHEKFLRDQNGYQNGLSFYIQEMSGIKVMRMYSGYGNKHFRYICKA